MMPDLAKIDRNVRRLVEQQAPAEDIEHYLSSEGVSAQEVLAYQPDQSVAQRAANWVGKTAQNVATAVTGKEDPEYSNVPVYSPDTFEGMTGQARAKTVAIGDDAYGDVLAKQLGDRFIRMERDANNYPVLVYKDEQGQEKKGYVNRPGLDWQDVDRVISMALPYVAGAGVAGRLTRGVGRGARALGQFLGASGTSIAQDVAAGQMGSKQNPATLGIDLPRAGITGLFGAGAEIVPLPILGTGAGAAMGALADADSMEERAANTIAGGVTGGLAGKGLQKLTAPPNPMRHIEDGKLASRTARVKAKKAGLDPDNLDPEDAEMFARGIDMTADEAELASAIKTNKFGIPTTKATRTKDPELSAIEKDIRYGTYGPEAKAVIDAQLKEQSRAIERSALSRGPVPGAKVDIDSGNPLTADVNPYERGIATMLDPQNPPTYPGATAPERQGSAIRQGLQRVQESGDTLINKAWETVTDLFPKQDALSTLPKFVDDNLGPRKLTERTTPAAMDMVQELRGFMSGKQMSSGSGLGEPSKKAMDLDTVRRNLLSLREGAANPADRAAAQRIYNGFNTWIDDVAQKGLVLGDPQAAVAMRTARQITKEVKGLWAPTDKTGKSTPAAKILNKIMDEDVSADGVIADLFGSSGPQSPPKAGALPALRHIRRALFGEIDGPGGRSPLIPRAEADRVWNDIRMAYWTRLVVDKKGKMYSPQVMKNNLDHALRNQSTLMNVLYHPGERRVMKQYADALDEIIFKDPNPSGTATTLRSLMKKDSKISETAKSVLQTAQKRETFSKHNFWMARFYQILAKNFPADPLGTKKALQMGVAKRAASQDLTPKRPPVKGYLGTPMGEPALESLMDAMQDDE